MIDWANFKKLLGNGQRKWLKRNKQTYHFISYNISSKEVSVMSKRANRVITQIPLDHFIEDFTLVKVGPEKPLF